LLRLPGIDINMQDENGFTVLHWASFAHHNNGVKLLLMYQADPNVKNNKKETPLHLAICQGNYKIALDLLKGGADANIQNQDGRTPLHMCSELTFQLLVSIKNQSELILALLTAGADPHLPDNYGKTLFRVAELEENTSLVEMLHSLSIGPN
jgi:ankyrin repeat protein